VSLQLPVAFTVGPLAVGETATSTSLPLSSVRSRWTAVRLIVNSAVAAGWRVNSLCVDGHELSAVSRTPASAFGEDDRAVIGRIAVRAGERLVLEATRVGEGPATLRAVALVEG